MGELTVLTDQKREATKAKALVCFEAGHTILSTAAAVGVTRETLYAWRTKDKAFAKAWDDAYERRLDHLEDVGFDRAAMGSDQLLMFLLRGGRSSRYGDKRQVEINQHSSVDVRMLRALPVDELLNRLTALRDAQRGLEIEGNIIDLDEQRTDKTR